MKTEINTKTFENGWIESERIERDALTDVVQKKTQQVLGTQEQHVREGLKTLGWTPPEEKGRELEDLARRLLVEGRTLTTPHELLSEADKLRKGQSNE